MGNKRLVVVLSSNYVTGLSVIRALGTAGYIVDLIATNTKKVNAEIISSSKFVRNSVQAPWKAGGEDSPLLNELMKYRLEEEKPVLFPVDEYCTGIVDSKRETLEELFVLPHIAGEKNGSLTEQMDREVQTKMAQKAGIRIADEWVISLGEELDIPKDVVYPCYCKPVDHVLEYNKKRAVCVDEDELRKHLFKLRRSYGDRQVLIQECLEIDKEIIVSGVCLGQEVIVPGLVKAKKVAQYESGVTVYGKLSAFEENSIVKEKIVNMLKQFHYYGMFTIKVDIVQGRVYFNKLDLYSSASNYAYFVSGVNLPDLYVKGVLGETYTQEETKISEFGKTFVNEKAGWEDYIQNLWTKEEYDDCVKKADIKLVNDPQDPTPGNIFNKEAQMVLLKRNTKGVVRRKLIPKLGETKYLLSRYPQAKKKNQRNPESEVPRVIVSGRNYCSNLCMARALGKAGYEVEVLRIFRVKPRWKNLLSHLKPDAYSKYVKAYHVCVSKRKNARIVEKLLSIADKERKMLLVPVDDVVANVIDEYYEELSEFYILPNINSKPGELNRMMSKEVQKDLAEAAGLPVINSCVIKTVNGEYEIPRSVKYPCFIKPNMSTNGLKSKMQKCDDEQELRSVLEELSAKKDIEMLVQDYVEIGKEYSILGFSTKESAVGPGFFRAEEGGHDGRRGVALTGVVVPCEEEQELIDKMVSFVGSLNFEGLYDIDLIQTVDGKMYFVEVNMRFGGSGYSITGSGVNLPAMYADYVYKNKPLDVNCKIEVPGKKFVSEKIMMEEYANGYLSNSEVKRLMKESDITFVKDPEDMRPYRHYMRFFLIAAALRMYHKMKG